jgi:NADP-dependent 3-hydroxy acid dehydrogenase YdfG
VELDLNGKVALVTGANRGIGAAITLEFAKEGTHLCLVARDSDRLAQVAESLRRLANTPMHVVSADLRDPTAPAKAIAQVVAQFGRLDLLMNNAGVTKRANFLH